MARQITLMGGEPEDSAQEIEIPEEVNGWRYAEESRSPGIRWEPSSGSDGYVEIGKNSSHSWYAKLRSPHSEDEFLTSRTASDAVSDARLLMRNTDPDGGEGSGTTPYDPTEGL